MKHLTPLTLAAALTVAPLAAEETDLSEGLDLLSQGTQLMLRGLMTEIEPSLRDLDGVLAEALGGLDEMLSELHLYHPPEILPNGDIIIRRRVPKDVEPEVGENGEIEL